jgi:trigger factor
LDYEIAVDNELEKEIEVSIPSSELDLLMDKEAEKLRKTVAIKGFRKGKVPKSLIKSKYRDAVKAQAVDTLVTKSYLDILKEKNWRPASHAKLLNIEEGDIIKFRLHFEVIPEFNVGNYRNLETFKSKPSPDDFLLEQGLNQLRERYAKINEVSRTAVVDDYVTMDLEVMEKDTVKNKQNNITIRIGDRSFPDEVNRVLVGVRKSEHKQAKVDNLVYKMFIKKIEEKEPPHIDDDFAKSLDYENVEDLKKKLMTHLKKSEEMRIEEELKESLSNILLERIHFNIPKSLIQNEYEKILQKSQLPDSDVNRERFWDIAEKRVRFNLILEKIAEKENIKVEDSEITNVVSTMGLKLNDENRSDVIIYIRSLLIRDKTLDFIYKNAEINKKGRIVSPKEAKNDTSSIRH